MKKNLTTTTAAILAIAAANPEGFTIDKNTLQPIKHGYAVAVKETQNSFDLEGLTKVIKYAQNHNSIQALGGWYNSKNGRFYFDAVKIITDFETAKIEAVNNNQLAFFDLDNLEEIEL